MTTPRCTERCEEYTGRAGEPRQLHGRGAAQQGPWRRARPVVQQGAAHAPARVLARRRGEDQVSEAFEKLGVVCRVEGTGTPLASQAMPGARVVALPADSDED